MEKYAGNTLFIKGLENLDFSVQFKLLRILKHPDYKALERTLKFGLFAQLIRICWKKQKRGSFVKSFSISSAIIFYVFLI